jgi:hypothetical protein
MSSLQAIGSMNFEDDRQLLCCRRYQVVISCLAFAGCLQNAFRQMRLHRTSRLFQWHLGHCLFGRSVGANAATTFQDENRLCIYVVTNAPTRQVAGFTSARASVKTLRAVKDDVDELVARARRKGGN